MDYIKQITDYLETCDGKITDVLYELYSILESFEYDEQIKAFQFFCENNHKIKSDGSHFIQKKYYTDNQIEISFDRLYRKDILNVIESLVRNSIKNNVLPTQFYKELWDLVQSSKICKIKRDRVLALFFIMDNDLIPYKNTGFGEQMDESTYNDIVDEIDSELVNEIEYIINLDLEQKTQKSSLLLDRLLSVQNKKQRIVLFSIILDTEKNKLKDDIKTYINKL